VPAVTREGTAFRLRLDSRNENTTVIGSLILPELTPERSQQLLAATREAAAAFVEDMPHICELLNKTNLDRGDPRRLSNILRRLLIDNNGDLRDIAAPRMGKVTIATPDNKPFYKLDEKQPYVFFGSGGATIFGVNLRAAMQLRGSINPGPGEARALLPKFEPGFDGQGWIPLPIDSFLSQKVLCLKGRWVNRRDAIKYVANVGSGVHSGAPREEVEKLVAEIRRAATYSVANSAFAMTFNQSNTSPFPILGQFKYQPDAIDPVLAEVLAAAHYLSVSPDIQKLVSLVKEELSRG